MPRPMTELPNPRFKVRKHTPTGTFYVVHFDPDHLRWEAYENISSSRVPIAKRYDDRGAAEKVAARFTARWPWKDFDRQLFDARRRGDHDWPNQPGEVAAAVALVRERSARP